MKKIFCILLVCVLMLTGCNNKVIKQSENNSNTSMFVEIERTMNYIVVYCKSTKVMYAISDGSYNHGTFTLLVNADGTPMLYKGE